MGFVLTLLQVQILHLVPIHLIRLHHLVSHVSYLKQKHMNDHICLNDPIIDENKIPYLMLDHVVQLPRLLFSCHILIQNVT